MNQPTTDSPRYYMRPYYEDGSSASIFERHRLNNQGLPFCVHAGLSWDEACRLLARLNGVA